jgi:hypothetical protein
MPLAVASGDAQAAALPDFQYAVAGNASCAEDGVALGDEAGAIGGMDRSLEAASPANLKGGLISG